MSTFLIGDIHGSFRELDSLLCMINFDPKLDTIWLTGDLVSRGPDSLRVLRILLSFKESVKVVLGNHDLNLLMVHAGMREHRTMDRFKEVLSSPDSDELIYWLKSQPIMQIDKEKRMIMTHAGILPSWDLGTAKRIAKEIENAMQSNYTEFLHSLSRKRIDSWYENMSRLDRINFGVQVFTRMRYCFDERRLEMSYKGSPDRAPANLKPWFSLLRSFQDWNIVFGHWSSLYRTKTPEKIYNLDTGCCWGRKLTAICWEDRRIYSVASKKSYLEMEVR